MGYKPCIAPAVVINVGLEIVALAIDLDDKPARMRDEICYIGAHWTLATNSKATKPMRLQLTPQQRLSPCH
jgi:hypothetical protein